MKSNFLKLVLIHNQIDLEVREKLSKKMHYPMAHSNNSDDNSTTSTDGESFTPTTNSSGSNNTLQNDPMFLNLGKGSFDNEWQMNYIINKRDGL